MRTLSIVMLLVVVLAGMASAQAMDKYELSFAGGYATATFEGDTEGVTYLLASGGKMIKPNIQIQGTLIYANLAGAISLTGIAPGVNYYFNQNPDAQIIPYVGLGLYYVRVGGPDESDTGLHWVIGAKSFLGQDPATADKAIFAEYRRIENVGFGDEDADLGSFMIGISNYF